MDRGRGHDRFAVVIGILDLMPHEQPENPSFGYTLEQSGKIGSNDCDVIARIIFQSAYRRRGSASRRNVFSVVVP